MLAGVVFAGVVVEGPVTCPGLVFGGVVAEGLAGGNLVEVGCLPGWSFLTGGFVV